MTDLIYTQNDLFTTFYAQTKEGEQAEREIASKCDGLPQVFNIHAKSTIAQLRKAGFTVAKSKKATKADFEAIFEEMDALGIS